MQRIRVPGGGIVSYDKYGSGPPLVLVHGAFSDHDPDGHLLDELPRSPWAPPDATLTRVVVG